MVFSLFVIWTLSYVAAVIKSLRRLCHINGHGEPAVSSCEKMLCHVVAHVEISSYPLTFLCYGINPLSDTEVGLVYHALRAQECSENLPVTIHVLNAGFRHEIANIGSELFVLYEVAATTRIKVDLLAKSPSSPVLLKISKIDLHPS